MRDVAIDNRQIHWRNVVVDELVLFWISLPSQAFSMLLLDTKRDNTARRLVFARQRTSVARADCARCRRAGIARLRRRRAVAFGAPLFNTQNKRNDNRNASPST